MPIKGWMKKFVGVFISASILVNTVVPIFAHSQINPENYISERSEDIKVCVSEETSSDKLMEIDLNGQKISSHLMGKDDAICSDETSQSKQLNKDQTVQLDDVLTDVSVRYKMKEQKLKEDFILNSKEAQNSFVLQYNLGDLHAEQINTQDILLLDKNGRAKMLISAPYMTDAAGACSEAVSLQIFGKKDGVLSVNLTADSSWLQDDKRSYPIEVDPLYSLPKDTLRKGDSNKDVAVLKSMLLEARFGAGVSCHEVMNDMRNELYGPITERFVRTFQQAMYLNPTGIADIDTLEVLARYLKNEGILDTQEHIDQFLKRVESRSSPETGEQVRGVASYFKRVNFKDLAVTAGITGVATVVGVACLPLVGVAGVLAIGATIGATANGVSEYAQQKEVGESVDMTRVGIKAIGGAVKGGMSAIPGVSMYNAFGKAVNVAGQTLRPVLSTAVGDAVGKAAVTAATNALTPTVVCHAVGAAGKVLASAAAKDTLIAVGGALATGAAEGIGCAVQSGKTVKEATKDAALNGACQAASVPVAAAVVVGGAACCATYVATKKPKPDPTPVVEIIDSVVIPAVSEKPQSKAPQAPEEISRSPSPGGSYHAELQQCECFPFFLFEAAPLIETASPTGIVIPFPAPVPVPAPVPMLPPVPIVVRPPAPTDPDFIGPKQFEPIELRQPRIGGSKKPLARNYRFPHEKEAKQAATRDFLKGGGGGSGGGSGSGGKGTKGRTIHHPKGNHHHMKGSHDHYNYGRQVVVVSGDSLWSIAQRYGLDHKELARINGISDPLKLQIGQVIKLG